LAGSSTYAIKTIVIVGIPEFEVWFLDNDQHKGARGISEFDVMRVISSSTQIPTANISITTYGTVSNDNVLNDDQQNSGNGTRWSDSNNSEKYLKAFKVRIFPVVSGVTSLSDIDRVDIQMEKPNFSVQMVITKPTPYSYDYFHPHGSVTTTSMTVTKTDGTTSTTHNVPSDLVSYIISPIVDSQYGHTNSSNTGEWYLFPLSP